MSMEKKQQLLADLQAHFAERLASATLALGEVTLEVSSFYALQVLQSLRDDFGFEQLMDVCGVDYAAYGQADWETEVSSSGFSRAVSGGAFDEGSAPEQRFAVVYHLLSVQHNQRLRVRVFAEGEPPQVASAVNIWSSADWFEREAFDLYGILFDGHPDLRRILTDYGFVGHPFRKDFPVSGHVEMRYDPEQGRVVYEPVSIEPRVLVPRVIRHDNRYKD